MSQSLIFLLLLLAISFISKNQSLMIAIAILFVLKVIGTDDNIFSLIRSKGINWGVTIITVAVLVPIATGEIGFRDLTDSLKSPYAWIALVSGIIVAILGKHGVALLAESPHITTSLVFGTVLSIAFFKGVAVGPLIGAGIAYMAMRVFSFFH